MANAAIEYFVGLTINHSLGSAERERSSAWFYFSWRKGQARAQERRVTSLQAGDNREVMAQLQFC
jgi:hypothetical protein